LLKKGSQIIEATGGNTGIGLALVAAARGYSTCFTMPSNISQDKINLMQTLGARVVLQPVVPFDDPQHYYHTAERLAKEENAVFLNQFENLSNYSAHFNSTAPEIWSQTQSNIDAFVSSAGTGGTISGCSNYLKEKNPNVQVFLVDPPGSGLLSYVKDGTFESQGSSLTEGIGIKRLTANFAKAKVDGAFLSTDRETVEMAYFLLRRDGIFVGPSAALNCVGAVKAARRLNKPGATIVTILCDGGERYRNTLYSRSYLEEKQLTPSPIPDADADSDPLAFVLP
jgi:cysteine synthase A